MPPSMVRHYGDPSEYLTDLKWTKAELCITARGQFSAKRIRFALPRVFFNRYSEALPRVGHMDHASKRALFIFATRTGPSWYSGTTEVPWGAVLRCNAADQSFQRSTGEFEFGALSLSIEDIEEIGATYGAGDFKPPRANVLATPNSSAWARLQKVHATAADLAELASAVIAVPEAARGLEEALLVALADCLAPPEVHPAGAGSHLRTSIMKRFFELLRAHPDGVLHTMEICNSISVSKRTLTTCCNETLGMSPHRYLKLRQLHLVRRALRFADPRETTVTNIATAHGFWDLGRFAGAYRDLFGELPSETLRQNADGVPLGRH